MNLSDLEIQAITLSLKVALCSTLICLPVALWAGNALARSNFWGKPIIESMINLPLVMPPVATGYLLLLLFGTNGWIGRWFYEFFDVRIAFSFYAAVLASVVVAFPLVLRSIRAAIEMLDTDLESASRMLGAGRLETFVRITIPLILPGLVSGLVLGFARSLGEFGATIVFAGNIMGETQTLPLAIYSFMQVPGQEPATLRLVLSAVVISFMAMILSEWYLKRLKNARG